MVRALVVLFHLLLVFTLTSEVGATLLQLRANSVWELAFYGSVSDTTAGLARLMGFDLVITAIHAGFVAGYALKWQRSATRLVIGSALMMVVVTPAAGWALVFSSLVVIIEEVRRRLPIWVAMVRDREDDD